MYVKFKDKNTGKWRAWACQVPCEVPCAVDGTVSICEFAPIPTKERFDENGNIVPIAPSKEAQLQSAKSDLGVNCLADAVKMIVELREKLAVATGVKFDPVPAELAAKLAAVESLKAEVVAEKEIAVEDGPVPMLPP